VNNNMSFGSSVTSSFVSANNASSAYPPNHQQAPFAARSSGPNPNIQRPLERDIHQNIHSAAPNRGQSVRTAPGLGFHGHNNPTLEMSQNPRAHPPPMNDNAYSQAQSAYFYYSGNPGGQSQPAFISSYSGQTVN
jgi:hypothetical protein